MRLDSIDLGESTMINMKSRNGSESDVIYVCYILFLSHVWQLYLTFHLCQCSQMSSSESDDSSDGEFF